jgi:hypothetical protein
MRIEQDGDYQKITINVAIDMETFDSIIEHYLIVEEKTKCEIKTQYIFLDDEELYLTKTGNYPLQQFENCIIYLIEGNYYVDYYDSFNYLIDTIDKVFKNDPKVKEHIVMKNTRDDIIIRFIGEVPDIIASFMIVDKLTKA